MRKKIRFSAAVISLLLLTSALLFGCGAELSEDGKDPALIGDVAGLKNLVLTCSGQGDALRVTLEAEIDPGAFKSCFTDYIVLRWDRDRYGLDGIEGNSDLSGEGTVVYEISFAGSSYTMEEKLYANGFGFEEKMCSLSVAFDIPRRIWNDWRYSEVESVKIGFVIGLNIISESKGAFCAEYFHCSDIDPAGISIRSETAYPD